MSDLVVIVPSRGRPQAVAELVEAFRETCTADTALFFGVDDDDPELSRYYEAMIGLDGPRGAGVGIRAVSAPSSMVRTLNVVAVEAVNLIAAASAIAFMGDDHRPRTKGWDTAYLAALELHPGLVYGNDLLQGHRLPTQVAMSAEVVRALGHMAPPPLTHLYVDNYWRDLGAAAQCITYLPDVVVEHLHPVAGKAQWDEGYKRVNDRGMYDRDAAAYSQYWMAHGAADVAKVRAAVGQVAAHG